MFEGDLDRYGAIAFFTFGNLTRANKNNTPAMSAEGKRRLLAAVAGGQRFLGLPLDLASAGGRRATVSRPPLDPFIAMLGGELASHGKPQEATVTVISPEFPGAGRLGRSFSLTDEW